MLLNISIYSSRTRVIQSWNVAISSKFEKIYEIVVSFYRIFLMSKATRERLFRSNLASRSLRLWLGTNWLRLSLSEAENGSMIEEKCLVIFFAVRERGSVAASSLFQLRTRSERENGNSADVERSRLAGRYLEVPTFGSSLFPRPLMGLTSPQSLSRLYPFSNPFERFAALYIRESKSVRVFGIGRVKKSYSFKSSQSPRITCNVL